MWNIDKLLKLVIEKFEETSRGKTVIFCLTLIGVAIVVDTMLTYTFPAYTLIAFIIFLGAFGSKTWEKRQMEKNKFWENRYK